MMDDQVEMQPTPKRKKYSFGGIEGDDRQSTAEDIIEYAEDEEGRTNLKHLCEEILARLRMR